MKKRIVFSLLLPVLLLSGCKVECPAGTEGGSYMTISQQEAKSLMDTQSGYIILDVRTEEEFATGHIPGAMVIPDTQIRARAEQELPDKGQLILVYCRSGRRSKNAAAILADMGYTNIREFGGILDWPYETE